MSRPVEPGAGVVSIGGLNPISDVPGFFTGFFTMQDPLQNRRIMGLGRIELAAKKIDFHPIGPSRGLGFAVSPDRKRGYGLLQTSKSTSSGRSTCRVTASSARTPFRGRPRMGLRVSSNGNVLYIHTAGNTIDLHDAASFKLLRTITLDGDMTGFTLVPPARPDCGRTLRVSPWTERAFRLHPPVSPPARGHRRHQPDQHRAVALSAVPHEDRSWTTR